ncbi:energy transducer TonB [Candidatus Nitronereus thalassa]|uniref:Energy transducer TonB n=1 Tax=Candidatus Nitronereus thalassa TaxID=3020898 RepID=A0ABU3KCG0_9BACT|nr:energy transducer TonB [Candidatus Nitronereus thalassa]MDT7043914.1 energy transducer TonB [Candidatus Nitronereus thalassa]
MSFAFAATAPMKSLSSEPPFLPFWAWSGLLHLGILALLSLTQVTSQLEKTPSVVKVTLIEAATPSTAPSTTQKTKNKEATPQPPAMLKAQRSVLPTPPPPPKVAKPLTTPTAPLTMAQVAVPQNSRERAQPIERSPLRDSRADNQVEFKNFLKVTQRMPVSRSYSLPTTPELNPSTSATQIPTHIPSPHIEAITTRDSPESIRSVTPNVLKAMAPGVGTIGKSKVGLGRTLPPVYPRIAREAGWEGTVVVRVAVQPDGHPEKIEIRKSSGYPVLDEAAVEAVKKWQFSPAKDGNIPIRSIVEIPINFDLRKQG